jgi:pyruvate formate lyase activating enzyme
VGVPNELILENARKIAEAGGKMQIRIPVIPQYNDSTENIKAAGEFCQSLGSAVTVIQLLPYHNLGVMKYERITENIVALEAKPPSDRKIASLKQLLEEMGLNVTVH